MVTITPENFKTEILDAPVPVLVDFYADWCGPCRALTPILAELSAEANGRYKIVKVDADEQPDLAAACEIGALPTILIVKEGLMTMKLVGLQNKARLLEAMGIG